MVKRKRKLRGGRVWKHPKMNQAAVFVSPEYFPTRVELLYLPSNLPTIAVTPMALFKMHVIVDAVGVEVGWLGTARWQNDTLVVDDVFLFEQEVSSGHTELSTDGLQGFAFELLEQENGVELFEHIRFWGHSHSNFGVRASRQDNRQMELFEAFGAEFFLRGIFNRRGRVSFSLYQWGDGRVIHDVPWFIEGPPLPPGGELSKLRTALRSEMREKVRRRYWVSYEPKRVLAVRTGGKESTDA